MGWKELMSDQYVNWSDRDARRGCKRSSTPTQNFVEATAFAAGTVAGISHRALQALWQAGMQVRPGTGSRAQALPFGQPQPSPTPHGLRPAGLDPPSPAVAGQLPPRAHAPRRGLRDQPRTATTPGKALVGADHGAEPLLPRDRTPSIPRRRVRTGQEGNQSQRFKNTPG